MKEDRLLRWIIFGVLIGIVVGAASSILLNVNDKLTEVREDNSYLLWFLPLGGVIIGYIYQYHGKSSRKGNDVVIEYIHYGQGRVPLRMGPIVYISSFITHLFGGSTGREGAAIQMGASIAEVVNKVFKIDDEDRKILIMSGVSGGFGSAFGAPLTGTLFGMEVYSIGKLKYEAFIPCFVSSLTGHIITEKLGVKHEQHFIQSIPGITGMTVTKIVIVSILFSFASVLYSQLRHGVKRLSEKYLKNLMIRAFVGGAIIIALTYLLGTRDYLGRGLPVVNKAFEDSVAPLAFLYKIIFTAITMGTGFRGGEVIPLFFVGATLGNTLSGMIDLPMSFLAALGIIAVFTGATNAPITGFIFAIELFDGKGLIFFFMACVISYIFSGHHGIYGAQKLYEPKSRLFHIKAGETISNFEKNKKKPKSN